MPGGDRALQRLGRGGERHAARRDARHEAVLGDRDQRRVEHAALRRRRQLAGDEQPGVVGEA